MLLQHLTSFRNWAWSIVEKEYIQVHIDNTPYIPIRVFIINLKYD